MWKGTSRWTTRWPRRCPRVLRGRRPTRPGIHGFVKKPARNFTDARGGGRIIGVLGDFTLSVAHYYTYLDSPTLRVVTPTTAPLTKGETPATANPINLGEFEAAVNAGQTSRFLVDHFHANQWFPKVQISGATVSFSVPKLWQSSGASLPTFMPNHSSSTRRRIRYSDRR